MFFSTNSLYFSGLSPKNLAILKHFLVNLNPLSSSRLWWRPWCRWWGGCGWSWGWPKWWGGPRCSQGLFHQPFLKPGSRLSSSFSGSSKNLILIILWSWGILDSQASQKSKEGHLVHLYRMPMIGSTPHPVHLVWWVVPSLISDFCSTLLSLSSIFFTKQGIKFSTLSSTNLAIFSSIFFFQCSFHLHPLSSSENYFFYSSSILAGSSAI